MDRNLLRPNPLDLVLWHLGLVRRSKWRNLAAAYRDVWGWWDSARNGGKTPAAELVAHSCWDGGMLRAHASLRSHHLGLRKHYKRNFASGPIKNASRTHHTRRR